jgi:hypothetical protein
MSAASFQVGDCVRVCDSALIRSGMRGIIAQDFLPLERFYDVQFDDDGQLRLMWSHELERIEPSEQIVQ